MKLFAFGGIALLAIGTVAVLTVDKPIAPGCSDTVVLHIVKTSVIDSPEARQMNVSLDKISDETGTLLEERWHCTARLVTNKGSIPVEYTVGLFGPAKFQVSVKASFVDAQG
jgi:hypothetical protein